MTETEMRLLHLSHYPNEVRQSAYQAPFKPARSGAGREAANGRARRGWTVGLAISVVAAFSLAQIF